MFYCANEEFPEVKNEDPLYSSDHIGEIDDSIERIVHLKAEAKRIRNKKQQEMMRRCLSAPVTSTISPVYPTIVELCDNMGAWSRFGVVPWSLLFDSIVGDHQLSSVN